MWLLHRKHFEISRLSFATKKVESYIKGTNHFLEKLKELGSLLKNAILYTIDAFGLYPNIPYEKSLASIRKYLDNRENKVKWSIA